MSEVMFKMIPLVLQGIDSLILYFPTRPSATHDLKNVGGGHGKVSHPTEMLRFTRLDFPILDEIDPFVRIGFVQRRLVDKPKTMSHPLAFTFELADLSGLVSLVNNLKQELVVTFFDPQDEMKIVFPKLRNMRRIGTQPIFDDD